MINSTLMFLNRWPLTFFDLYRSQKTKVLYFVYTQVIKGSGESFRQTDRQTDINSPPHYLRLWSPRRTRNASYYNPIKKVNSGINGMSFKTCLLKHGNSISPEFIRKIPEGRQWRGMNFNYWCCSITSSDYLAFLNW